MIYAKYAMFAIIIALTSFYFTYERRRVKQYMHFLLPFVYIALVNLVFFTDYLFLAFGAFIIAYHFLMFWGCNRGIGKLVSTEHSHDDKPKESAISQGLDFATRNRQKVLYIMIVLLMFMITAVYLTKF